MRRLTSSSAEYSIWKGMIARCTLPETKGYKNYGGRGICIHDGWMGYPDGFNRFVHHIGERPSTAHSVDRINVDGNYEPGNVRWATSSEQARNRRTNKFFIHKGQRICHADLAQELGITPQSLQKRMRRWPIEKIIAPLHQKRLFGSGIKQDGERGTNAKLNRQQAQTIFDRRTSGCSTKELSQEFGISERTVLDIQAGNSWRDLNRSAGRAALAQSDYASRKREG